MQVLLGPVWQQKFSSSIIRRLAAAHPKHCWLIIITPSMSLGKYYKYSLTRLSIGFKVSFKRKNQ